MDLVYIFFFSLLGSVGALSGAGILLLFPKLQVKFRTSLISYAIGTLLGATFIGLLPNATEKLSPEIVFLTTLGGLVVFFVIEKILRIPHFHAHTVGHRRTEAAHEDIHPAAVMILIGDALHNFVDGVLITTAFFVSVPLGLVTSFAIVAHEVPQELGDFVVLLESGMSRMKAYWLNFLSALTTVVGALTAYWLYSEIEGYVPYILAVAAASFLHIATVDLAPILHHYGSPREALKQTAGILIGIGTILVIHKVSHG